MAKTKIIDGFTHKEFIHEKISEDEQIKKSTSFLELMKKRRSIREFSSESIPFKIIENIIETASLAPSGANKQPWSFCVITDQCIKSEIRKAAEKEEELSYTSRMSEQWKSDLKHLGTNASKPFLEVAPYLIVVFKKPYEIDTMGNKLQNYYVNESVGIACGMLIAAIQNAGLVTLTHTPSPMRFLEKILRRPENERAYSLLPVGLPAKDTFVPNISKKGLDEVLYTY